ncbi:MAG TPA: hypothetical protein VIK81_04125 [Patescibacteria group bacterium]
MVLVPIILWTLFSKEDSKQNQPSDLRPITTISPNINLNNSTNSSVFDQSNPSSKSATRSGAFGR